LKRTGRRRRESLPRRPACTSSRRRRATLTDYLATIERAQQQFREKIRRGRLAVVEDHDRRWAELDASTKRQLSEMTARIEREHAEARLALEAETRASLREIDDLAKRIGE
jgi:flagellar motility protein MotE (MotC chaperone)